MSFWKRVNNNIGPENGAGQSDSAKIQTIQAQKQCPYVPRILMISAKLTIHLSKTTQTFPVFSLIYDASKDILLFFVGLIKAMND